MRRGSVLGRAAPVRSQAVQDPSYREPGQILPGFEPWFGHNAKHPHGSEGTCLFLTQADVVGGEEADPACSSCTEPVQSAAPSLARGAGLARPPGEPQGV